MSRQGAAKGRHADRAAQFMPFAALTGYYDLVRAQERVSEPRHELTEEEAGRISAELSAVRKGQFVRVTHYERDAYVTTEGIVTGMDPVARELTIVRRRIRFDDIWGVRPIP